jgi:glycosyltransferase involved in cell wall biosynthesis
MRKRRFTAGGYLAYNRAMYVALHTPFVVQKHTGIARHIFGLLRGLAQTDPETRYLCFWPVGEPFPDWLPENFVREPYPYGDRSPVARVLLESGFMRQARRRHGFDLIHSPFGYLPPGLPCPSVVTIHDCRWLRHPATFSRLRGAFLRWACPRSVRAAATTVAISGATRDEILGLIPGADPARVRVCYPGLDDWWHEPPRPEASDAARRLFPGVYFLAVGTHEPHKNVPRLLEAFALLRRDAPDLRLVLVGTPRFATGRSDDIDAVLARLNLGESVVRAGVLDDETLKAAYAGAVGLCFPSLYEGFGYPPLEAMALGVPAVTSRASCLPEVVGYAAELVDPLSPESIAGGMKRVLNDPERRAELIKAGADRARRYAWSQHAREIRVAYADALNGGG